MSLNFTHKPDYFLSAQLFIRHLENYVEKHPEADNAIFDLRDIYELFRGDLASATTNLDVILNIADEYKVDTLEGDQKIIQSYQINAKNNTLLLELNAHALTSLRAGKSIIAPDANLHE